MGKDQIMAIEINDELMKALKGQISLLKLVIGLAPAKADGITIHDLEERIKQVNKQIAQARKRARILKEEKQNGKRGN